MVTHQVQVGERRQSETDILPLSHSASWFRTWKQFVVESVNDRFTHVLRLHAYEADAATDSGRRTENARGYDGAEVGEHHLEVLLGCVQR